MLLTSGPALAIYRSLPSSERATYEPPAGMRGAPAVRALQQITEYLRQPHRSTSPSMLQAMRAAYRSDTRDMRLTTIPLGPQDRFAAERAAQAHNVRLRNWKAARPTDDRARNRSYATIDNGRYSSRCTYTHYTYVPLLLSAGRISDDGAVLGAVIDTAAYTLVAPRGYRWGIDDNGIRLYRITCPDEDYHPTSDDVRSGIRPIAAQLRAHAESRRAARREKQRQDAIAKLASAHGIWVSLADSRRAGNCAAGTVAYCERHGLDRTRHYPAEVLLRAEPSDRVQAAIDAARKRQIADWERGYSEI